VNTNDKIPQCMHCTLNSMKTRAPYLWSFN